MRTDAQGRVLEILVHHPKLAAALAPVPVGELLELAAALVRAADPMMDAALRAELAAGYPHWGGRTGRT
jgi:hypothetical protein